MKLKRLIESVEDGNFFHTHGGFPAPWEDFAGRGVFKGVYITLYGFEEYTYAQKPNAFGRDWIPEPGVIQQQEGAGKDTWDLTLTDPVVTKSNAEAAITRILREKYGIVYKVEVTSSGEVMSGASNREFGDLLSKVKRVEMGPDFMASFNKVDNPEVKRQVMDLFRRGEHERN